MRRSRRRNLGRTANEPSRLVGWILEHASRWGVARLYLHPCGDLVLVPDDVESPFPDRMLAGVYTAAANADDVREDVELLRWDWEAAA